MIDKEALIKRTKNYGTVKNKNGTKLIRMSLSLAGSVSNVIRSEGRDKWGIEEACRLYHIGREAWLKGDFETVADLFGVLT
jgi:hypothetical protein